MSRNLRVGFSGASGTGKSTLAAYLSETRGLQINPIGSRSVSRAMGFESPYDVDKAGMRAEFQCRLATEKIAWEAEHESFVTDRTTLDNLAYTMLHDVHAIDAALLDQIVDGLGRYTHVVFCPVDAFCNIAGDPNRVQDATYHKLYEVVMRGLLDRFYGMTRDPVRFLEMRAKTLIGRRQEIDSFLSRRSYMDDAP